MKPLSVVVGEKGYDSEDNHVMVREKLKGFMLYHDDMKRCTNMETVANTEGNETWLFKRLLYKINVKKMKLLYQS